MPQGFLPATVASMTGKRACAKAKAVARAVLPLP